MQQSPTKLVTTCLTIGGSDSGGAAGIQADLKTWTLLGVYGMSALTAVTAQNSVKVSAVQFMPPDFLSTQITTVITDYAPSAIKTGFIGKPDLVETISQSVSPNVPLVIDPVLVNHKGDPMFDDALTAAYRQHLFPRATLVTPNLAEAELITFVPHETLEDVMVSARAIHSEGCQAVLIKGFRQGDQMIDVLFDGRNFHHLPTPFIETKNRHGSGDTLSAAIAAHLSRGESLTQAVQQAQAFTAERLAAAKNWKLGKGHGPLALLEIGE